MSNMSYCRFQNTLGDLEDCLEALRDLDGDVSDLSHDEANAAETMMTVAEELAAYATTVRETAAARDRAATGAQ